MRIWRITSRISKREGLDAEGLFKLAESKLAYGDEIYTQGLYESAFEQYHMLACELEELGAMSLQYIVSLKEGESYWKRVFTPNDIGVLWDILKECIEKADIDLKEKATDIYIEALCELKDFETAVNCLLRVKEQFAVSRIMKIMSYLSEEEQEHVYAKLLRVLDDESAKNNYKAYICQACYCKKKEKLEKNNRRMYASNSKYEHINWTFSQYQFLDRKSEFTGRLELLDDRIISNEAVSLSLESFGFIESLSIRGLKGATVILGDKYRDGCGCGISYEKALECYEKAADGYMKNVALKRYSEVRELISKRGRK